MGLPTGLAEPTIIGHTNGITHRLGLAELNLQLLDTLTGLPTGLPEPTSIGHTNGITHRIRIS